MFLQRLSECMIGELEGSIDEEKFELFRVCRMLAEKEMYLPFQLSSVLVFSVDEALNK